MRNWAICLEYKTGPKTITLTAIALPHDTHPFHNVCRKDVQCGESSTAGFYVNFGGDPFTDDAPHDSFMRSVFFHMDPPYGKFYTAMALCAVCT